MRQDGYIAHDQNPTAMHHCVSGSFPNLFRSNYYVPGTPTFEYEEVHRAHTPHPPPFITLQNLRVVAGASETVCSIYGLGWKIIGKIEDLIGDDHALDDGADHGA